MADVVIRDPKTGKKLGRVNDETCVTEISEDWKAKKPTTTTVEEDDTLREDDKTNK